MTSERLLNMSIKVLYLPNTFIPPQNKFLATPLVTKLGVLLASASAVATRCFLSVLNVIFTILLSILVLN